MFILLPGFSLMPFAAAVDTLRQANRALGKEIYRWTLISENGQPVLSSSGIALEAQSRLTPPERGARVVVCGGVAVREASTRPILSWLRRAERTGCAIGAICTGTQTLAMAGLLTGYGCTIHWEHRDAFAEEFPELDLREKIFVIDRDRFTASGGSAPADLMLRLIAEQFGPELARDAAEGMVHTAQRTERDGQRLSIPARIGVRHPRLAAAIRMMEEELEEPVSPALLAQRIGMSTRQLERLFRRYLDRSPKRYYMELRLDRARKLLMQTDMSVIDIGLACGFSSPSHFSKCYRAQFGATPYRARAAAPKTA